MKKSRSIDWNLGISTGENARLELPRVVTEFFVLGRTAAKFSATPTELHAFRLAAKRLRYTLELFLPVYGPRLGERVEQVRRIQSLLGDRQDCVVLSERIKAHGEDPVLLAALHKLASEGSALEAKFRRYWTETFDAPGEEAAWTRYLSRRPPRPRAALPQSARGKSLQS